MRPLANDVKALGRLVDGLTLHSVYALGDIRREVLNIFLHEDQRVFVVISHERRQVHRK